MAICPEQSFVIADIVANPLGQLFHQEELHLTLEGTNACSLNL